MGVRKLSSDGRSNRINYDAARLRAIKTAFGDLTEQPIFTTWKLVRRGGKPSKVPAHPPGTRGVVLGDALASYQRDESITGIGVMLGPVGDTELVLWGADYDGHEKGPLPPGWPRSKTYAERSPSGGDRFHVLGTYKGEPLEGRRTGAVEIYTASRYFTLTGDRINGASILDTSPLPFYGALGVPNPQPSGAEGAIPEKHSIEPVEEKNLTAREKRLFRVIHKIEDADDSKRDFIVLLELLKRGATDEEAVRITCAAFWRKKLARPDYLARTLKAAREQLEKDFRDESREIGEGEDAEYFPRIYRNVNEMLAEAIFIADGSQVVLRRDTRLAWSFPDFKNQTAASVCRDGETGRPAGIAQLWLRSPRRVTVQTRTFRAGVGLFCKSPDDVSALNTWREPARLPVPKNWRELAEPFLQHVAFLVPDEADREFLLNWLAHIEQRPGELPHVHVLMYTRVQGIGRNLLTSILARVWAGSTALDVDLARLIEGEFNGRLSRKTFAVCNEVQEGGGGVAVYRRADKLKALLTDEYRHINVKFGRQHVEFNSCRWLLLSNHENALPLDQYDRRIRVVQNPEIPRSPTYYANLYELAAKPEFIASVREALRVRDISKFNPSMPAPMTATKVKVIEASMSEAELTLKDLVAHHHADVISTSALIEKLFGDDVTRTEKASLRFIAARAGLRKYEGRSRVAGRQQRFWIIRNYAKWMEAAPLAVAQEAALTRVTVVRRK
jgi:hypothetical protein